MSYTLALHLKMIVAAEHVHIGLKHAAVMTMLPARLIFYSHVVNKQLSCLPRVQVFAIYVIQ
jgi:hypothetical protein